MTHFLARVVDRACGTAPRVEPIVASRFGPDEVAEFTNGTEVAPISRAPSPSRIEMPGIDPVQPFATEIEAPKVSHHPATNAGKTPPIPEFPAEEKGPTLAPNFVRPQDESRIAIGIEEPSRPSAGENGPRTTASLIIRPDATPAQTASGAAEKVIETAHETLLVPQVVRPAPVATYGGQVKQSVPSSPAVGRSASPRRPTGEGVRRLQSAMIVPNESPEEQPIVRVTIGRIEVRAVQPPASPPRKVAASTPPKLTLDAYLKARKEGTR